MSTPLELEKELHLMTHERLREAEAKLTAATARAEKAERERDEKHHSFVRGARVAHELTHETQTAEDYAVDLVRQVKQARTERDALRAENERLTARVGVLRGVLASWMGHAMHSQEERKQAEAALSDPGKAAAERDEKLRGEALREAATHLEESAVQFKRPADRAMIVLAAHYVRALATKGGTT